MRIGFDIDDTLINLRKHAFHLYNRKLGQNVSLELFHKLQRVEIHELFGMDEIAGHQMWTSSLEEIYFTDCPIFEGAVEVIQQLQQAGHDIYYITSRPKSYCSKTRQWLVEKGFPVKDNQFYCGMQDHEKIEIIQSLKLNYYFDDKPAVIDTLQNVKTVVFVKDQPYNQHITAPRVVEWKNFNLDILK